MPIRYLDPNGDSKADWTETPVGTAWSALDDGIRQPTTPTLTDFIRSSTSAQNSRQDMGTFTLPADEEVKSLVLWVYATTGASTTISITSLASGSGLVGGTVIPAGSSAAWFSNTYTGTLTQAQIDSLQAQHVLSGTSQTTVYATYMIVTTRWKKALPVATETDSAVAIADKAKRKTLPVAKTYERAGRSDAYASLILADDPELYWRLGEASGSVLDSSGNGHTGTVYQPTYVTRNATGLIKDDANGGISISRPATETPPIAAGVTADDYKPYVPDSQRSFEAWVILTDIFGAPTLWAGDGLGGPGPGTPHPTWEWFTAEGMGIPNSAHLRYYAKVNTYPVGWTDYTVPTLIEGERYHIVGTFDDATSMVDLWINGVHMGQKGPNGYYGVPMKYDTVTDPGFFTIGYRGFRSHYETWIGTLDEIAVYERILTEVEIENHYAAGIAASPSQLATNIAKLKTKALPIAAETDDAVDFMPAPNITVAPSATKISRVSGKDVTTFTIRGVGVPYVEYKLKAVPDSSSPHTAGTTLESATGTFPPNTDHSLDITDDELVDAGVTDGTHVIKVFIKNADGIWSL